ncbi:hypothetical protein HAP48_0014855 [Bradyrhizobium septentrionale]|uniref:Uncharacterized protein n=1 Tax=Bradyrhizobium septentrionale TaxID=1404411 RepID=A0A973W9Q0_9BRAD|nr:hypothetical protein [Bradyrhizobium septentrionale]UGY18609.1 hypothetical protein HAP48_0014855 [Bradyrhizobium septentrionale]
MLARYPEEVITVVTHPMSGLPTQCNWLPTVKEVYDACEAEMRPIQQRAARENRIKEQLLAREEADRATRPTLGQLKAKYGENWGLSVDARVEDDRKADSRQAMERVRREY